MLFTFFLQSSERGHAIGRIRLALYTSTSNGEMWMDGTLLLGTALCSVPANKQSIPAKKSKSQENGVLNCQQEVHVKY